jgi:hypothetical protein
MVAEPYGKSLAAATRGRRHARAGVRLFQIN